MGILDTMDRLLSQQHAHIQQVLWSLSNITAGSQDQIYKFVSHENLVQKVFTFLDSDQPQIHREALYVLCNLITTYADSDVHYRIASFNNFQIIHAFVKGLDPGNGSVCAQILESLDVLLKLDLETPLLGLDSIAHKFR